MNRRDVVPWFVCLLALLPFRAKAQEREPFPLAPRPNPSASCATPFVRRTEAVDRREQFRTDCIVWAHDNAHLRHGYILMSPEVAGLAPPTGMIEVGGITFLVEVAPVGVMAPGELYGLMADCGQML
jgi:hypothetical protein